MRQRDHWGREGVCTGKGCLPSTRCGPYRVEIRKAAPQFRGASARTVPLPRGNGLELRTLRLKRPRQAPPGGV